MAQEIAQLLELQSIDQRLTEASERIKRLERDRSRIKEKVVDAQAAFDTQQATLKQLEHDSLMKNLAVDELDANIRAYQHRLDTGIISFKEMEDLRAKISSERKRISQMEDEALQMMDAIAQGKQALVEAEGALQARHSELDAAISDVDNEIAKEESTIKALDTEREHLTESMSDFMRAQYDSLHRKYADPIVPIDHTTCSGCKLKLSGSTVERARGSLSIVTCEHCSRILYIA